MRKLSEKLASMIVVAKSRNCKIEVVECMSKAKDCAEVYNYQGMLDNLRSVFVYDQSHELLGLMDSFIISVFQEYDGQP